MRGSANLTEDIRPPTDFKRNTANFVKLRTKTKRPVVLTINGNAKLVVQDADSYQRMIDRLDRLEAAEAIRQGLKDVEEGRVRDAHEALGGFRVKLGVTG